MVSGSHLGAVVTLVASRMPSTPEVKPSPRPARNFLEGHRYLTEEEYKEQAASATADALAGLVETEEYRRWVAKNHHRLGARAAAESDDEDGSDY